MALVVRPEADLDIFEAALWYEGERGDLGTEFLDAIQRSLLRIEQHPRQFPLVTQSIRRALVDRFPFGVFFLHEDETATVIAVMPLHRDPLEWQARQ